MSPNSCISSIEKLICVFLEKHQILYKNCNILREIIGKSRIFHDFLSVRMSHDDMGGILCIDCLRTVTFLDYLLIQIIALLLRPMFEALEIPYDWKIFLKTKQRLNLHILKNILVQKYLVISEKFQLIWWSKLDFRCVYFALWSCLNKHQYW